jgi:hypothetical protein
MSTLGLVVPYEKMWHMSKKYVSDITFGSKFLPIRLLQSQTFGICKIIELEVKLDIIICKTQDLR